VPTPPSGIVAAIRHPEVHGRDRPIAGQARSSPPPRKDSSVASGGVRPSVATQHGFGMPCQWRLPSPPSPGPMSRPPWLSWRR
jgi:hypothetical protein